MTTATALDPEAPMTPAELAEAMVDALHTMPDPVERYRAARDAEPLMKAALAQVARNTVNEMWDAGKRGAEIAELIGVSRQRVEQLVSPDRQLAVAEERLAQQEARLREREERLTARLAREEAKLRQQAELTAQRLARQQAQGAERTRRGAQRRRTERRVAKAVEGAA